jgi:hypothetical protein
VIVFSVVDTLVKIKVPTYPVFGIKLALNLSIPTFIVKDVISSYLK